MSVKNPRELVAEFKKSGEFDRLRRDLLTQFRNGEGITSFMSRVDDIVQQKLSLYGTSKLSSMGPDALHADLMQEMDRYPLVERAIADMPALSDPAFKAGIQRSLESILKVSKREGKGDSNGSTSHINGAKDTKHAEESDISESELCTVRGSMEQQRAGAGERPSASQIRLLNPGSTAGRKDESEIDSEDDKSKGTVSGESRPMTSRAHANGSEYIANGAPSIFRSINSEETPGSRMDVDT